MVGQHPERRRIDFLTVLAVSLARPTPGRYGYDPTTSSTFAMSGRNRSVWKLFVTPCSTAAMRSRPAPVSTDGLGSGTSVPSACRSNCMKTRFQISRKRSRLGALNKGVERKILDIQIGPLTAGVGRECPVGGQLGEVHIDLRTRTTRPGIGHLPEVVLGAQPVDAAFGHTGHFLPELTGFVVFVEDRDTQMLPRNLQIFGDELPREPDRIALEVVAEGKIAQHLEERVVTRGVADLLEVVVLPTGPHTLLRRGSSPLAVGRFLHPEKDFLELHHPRVDEQQGGVVGWHQR